MDSKLEPTSSDKGMSSIGGPASTDERAPEAGTTLDHGNPESEQKRPRLIYRDQIYDKRTRQIRLVRSTPKQRPSKKFNRCVLLIRRIYNDRMVYEKTEVDVKGVFLLDELKEMYKDTQGVSLGAGNETVSPELLFLSMKGLESRLAQLKACSEKDKTIQHAIFEIEACKEFVEVEFSSLIKKRSILLAENKITFQTLWSILPSKTLIISKDDFDQPRVFRLESQQISRARDGSYVLVLNVLYTESNGEQIGVASTQLVIPQFEDAVYITTLPAYPVMFHPDRPCLKKILLRRGRKQLKFHARGHQLREHQGFALMENNKSEGLVKFRTHGRIIVDAATFEELKPSNRMIPTLEAAFPKPSTRYYAPDPFSNTLEPTCQSTDEEEGDAPSGKAYYLAENMPDIAIIMLSGKLYGYSLGDSVWATFAVTRVSRVIWDRNIIKSLEMLPEAKTLLYNLIKAHSRSDSGFDDIVKDKGKGLVGLLMGPPGVGKTLTAEAVAETAQLPLFILSCGSLGRNSVEINKNLRHFLELASRWKAVLLLDEADVYLAKRNDSDLERNAIISVFLREIEYYTGILILTTNRAKKIDSAFQSRIHFCHRYHHHNPDSRKKIWKSFVNKSQLNDKISVHIDDEGLDELAKLSFNGREIKNAMSIAVKLAASKKANEDNVVDTSNQVDTNNEETTSSEEEDVSELDSDGEESNTIRAEKIIAISKLLQDFDFEDSDAEEKPQTEEEDLLLI